MDIGQYFKSLNQELSALKDRVRQFIDKKHWLTDGEWKESVLRSVLRQYLPEDIGVGRGFIITKERPSSQIDLLLYDKTKPTIFQDGTLVFVTPDAVRGVIEVKSKIKSGNIHKDIAKLHKIGKLLKKYKTDPFDRLDILQPGCEAGEDIQHALQRFHSTLFLGIFYYENDHVDADKALTQLYNENPGKENNRINCLVVGQDLFVRYWPYEPESTRLIHERYDKWHAYQLAESAQAYFIHNVIGNLCPESVHNNQSIWFPVISKESSKIAEKDVRPSNHPKIP